LQKQNSGKVNNKATGSAGRTYTANSTPTRGPHFDYPKTLNAMLLLIPGVFKERPVDWFSAAYLVDELFRSLRAIFPIVKKMNVQKCNL
jgi:hypothetical protein